MRGHTPVPITNFMGLYDRGRNESVLADHFSVSENLRFGEREFSTRYGTDLIYTNTINIKKFVLYKRVGEATRLLILTDSGNLYDSTNPGAPILSIPSMTGFRMVNFFGRAYITPVDVSNGVGVSGEFVYVYDGAGVARKIAGDKPSGTITAVVSGLSGNVEAGYHIYAVAYETESGHITKPGPDLYAVLESDGTKKVEFTDIPVGPVGTVKKHLLATRSILVYNGDQSGYEFFFIPGGDIDNANTTATVDFYDADLFKSADYLFDQYEELPACAGVGEYKSRLIAWNENLVYVSKAGEPESFDALAGFITIGQSDTDYINDCVEYREGLYIHKDSRAFVAQDNGNDPATWPPISIDKGSGSSLNGIIKIWDAQGVNVDKFLVCSRRGVVLFTGLYSERELTYKIDDVWKRVNKNYLHLVHGYQDPESKLVFIAVPLDAATVCSHILMGDYSLGMDAANIKWSIWSFPWNPESILVDTGTNAPVLKIANSSGVYYYGSSYTNDDGVAIAPVAKTAFFTMRDGYINHVAAVKVRATGTGLLNARLWDAHSNYSDTLVPALLASVPTKEITYLANFVIDRFGLELKTTSINEQFTVTRIDLFAKLSWSVNP